MTKDARSEDRVLDEIDRLVDEELAAGPTGEYYCASSQVFEKCCRCPHEFHGLRCRWCGCEGTYEVTARRDSRESPGVDEPPRWLGRTPPPSGTVDLSGWESARTEYSMADLIALRESLWDSRSHVGTFEWNRNPPRWEVTVGSDYRIPHDDVRCSQCRRYLPNVTVPRNFRFDMLCQQCALDRGMDVNPSAIAVVAEPAQRPSETVEYGHTPVDPRPMILESPGWDFVGHTAAGDPCFVGHATGVDSCPPEATQSDETTIDGPIPSRFAPWFAGGDDDA